MPVRGDTMANKFLAFKSVTPGQVTEAKEE